MSQTTTAPATDAATTSSPAKTVGQVQAEILAALESSRDPTVVGEIEFLCEGSGPVGLGDVLSCQSRPFTPAGEPIDSATFTVVIVSDDGTWAAGGASGPPDWQGAPAGLNCDQFFALALDRGAPPYDRPPGDKYAAENYLYTTAYFFAQGAPSLMDADGNGVPCETVYPPGVVDEVWSGGLVRVP